MQAVSVIKAFKKKGIRVPEDIWVKKDEMKQRRYRKELWGYWRFLR